MRLIATMMVRDEADIVAAMIEHHLDQGVDTVIVTDNGSVDGTTEILEAYARTGRVELHHDPVHKKQQGAVVTGMARRARTHFRADWVLNLDADEFQVPLDRRSTVRRCLEATPLHLNAFTVPVTNVVGPPAHAGAGAGRLVWRDCRPQEELQRIGIFAHPTPNAVHRGESDVVVAQGNHFVSLVSNGQPDDAAGTEVLHLPWRSWAQLERKVVNAGLAYEGNPDLRPSPNHHGMKDFRRHQDGRLWPAYLARTPTRDELRAGADRGAYVEDTWLWDHLREVVGRALLPDLLGPLVDGSQDAPLGDQEHVDGAAVGRRQLAEEIESQQATTTTPARSRGSNHA